MIDGIRSAWHPSASDVPEVDLSTDALVNLVLDGRRRALIGMVALADDGIEVERAAEIMAAREDHHDPGFTEEEQFTVLLSLYKGHISVLEDHGVVDRVDGTLYPTERTKPVDEFVQILLDATDGGQHE